MMEFDATQAIDFSDEDSDTDVEIEKKPVAFLTVFAQRDIPESRLTIYEGENFIGRHDSNAVHLPHKALSKQHACIEVQGNTHLIYDMESRNKTRRAKMFLKPNVRYELRDSDTLIFGDVKCQYMFAKEEALGLQEASDSGSETDSDLMLQPPDSETTAKDDKSSLDDENENDSSFNLNDLLQPTQACDPSPKLQFKTPRRLSSGKVFAAESDDDSPTKTTTPRRGDTSFIPDTQQSAQKTSVSMVEDSDSDTDIEADNTAPFNVSTLAVAQTQAVNDTLDQQSDDADMQDMDNTETQAINNDRGQGSEDSESEPQDMDTMETQAVAATVADMENAATVPFGSDDMETQAYDQDDSSSDTDVGDMRQSILDAPTQAFGIMDSDTEEDEPKSNKRESSGPTLLLESSTTSSDGGESPLKQVVGERNLFDEPTQPCDGVVSDSDSDTDIEGAGAEAETQAIPAAETQPVRTGDSSYTALDDMATVPIALGDESDDDDDDDDTDIENDPKPPSDTLAVGDLENMATVPMAMEEDDDSDTDISEGGGVNLTSAEQATQAVDCEGQVMDTLALANEATQAVGDALDDTDAESGLEDAPTLALANEATQAVHDTFATADAEIGLEDVPTLALANEATQAVDDTFATAKETVDDTFATANAEIGLEDAPTLALANEAKQAVDDAFATADAVSGLEDVPTLAAGDDAGTGKEEGGDEESEVFLRGDGKEMDTDDDLAPTQPYGTLGDSAKPNCQEDEQIDATQAYGDEGGHPDVAMETDFTQPYGDDDAGEEGMDVAMDTEDSEVESTQAYGMQSNDTQIPDSQEDVTEPTTSSRFPVFSTTSPSRSCLKQPKSDKSPSKARKVMFEPSILESDGDSEEFVEESFGRKGRTKAKQPQAKSKTKQPAIKEAVQESETVPVAVSRTSQRGKRNAKDTASKSEDETKQSAPKKSEEKKESAPAATRTSQKGKRAAKDTASKSEETKAKQVPDQSSKESESVPVAATRTSRRGKGKVEDTSSKSDEPETPRAKSGKSKEDAASGGKGRGKQIQEAAVDTSPAPKNVEVAMGRGKRTRKGKAEDTAKETSSSAPVTETDAGPTRKKEPIEPIPEPVSRRGARRSKVSNEQDKKSPGSKNQTAVKDVKTEEEGKAMGLTLKLRRTGKTTGGSVSKSGAEWENAGHPQIKLRVRGDDEDSDETASLSSTASSIKDLAEVETEARPSRSSRRGRSSQVNVVEVDGPQRSSRSTRNRNGQSQEKMDSQEETVVGRRSKRQNKDTSPSGTVNIEEQKSDSSAKGKGSAVKEDIAEKNSPATSKRSRRTLNESLEKSSEVEKETNVRKSSRKAATDSQGNEEQDKPKSDGGATFAVPKPVSRTGRSTKQRDLSPQQEAESSSTETRKRGGRTATKAAELPSKDDLEKETEQSNRRGRKAASASNQTPAKQESAQPSGTGKSASSRKRGRSSAVPEVVVTEAKVQRESRTARHMKDEEEEKKETPSRSTKRGAASAPSVSPAPAKKPRPTTPSPTSSPAGKAKKTPEHLAASPSLRRRTSDVRPKVIFTGVCDSSWQKTVTSLGGELVDSAHDCTHLITDKVRRTVKFLCCLARGVAIVTPDWLEKSKSSRMFTDPATYQLRDRASEKQHGFTLSASLQRAGQGGLLVGYRVHVTPGVKPEPAQMKDIIKCAGGEYLAKLPTKATGAHTVVVSCEADKAQWAAPSRVGIPVISAEFILTGILRQEILLNVKEYQLK